MSGFRSERLGGRTVNASEAARPLLELVDRVHEAKRQSLRLLALTLVRQIKITLSFPGRGRIYRRGRRRHQASAPGQPPAVDRGQLRNSIAMEELPNGAIRVGTNDVKAPWLEFGTMGPEYTGGHIAPRPFMRPALAAVRLWWQGTITATLQRAARRRGR
jgi:phage gpG-like protein